MGIRTARFRKEPVSFVMIFVMEIAGPGRMKTTSAMLVAETR